MIGYAAMFIFGGCLGVFITCLVAVNNEENKNIGIWQNKEHGTCKCSKCGWLDIVKTPYCPYCGAKMKEGECYGEM